MGEARKLHKIAIIPARAGSKGLKDKNILELNGHPLMWYSINPAVESRLFDKVVLTTDSWEYAEIAKGYGCEIILRDPNLATDDASIFVVVKDVFDQMADKPDYFVLLQPTSPLRNSRHIQEAASLFENNYGKFDFLVSVKEAEHVDSLVKPIDEDMSLKYFDQDFTDYSRQKRKCYSPNGAIFFGKTEAYLKQGHFFGKRAVAYMMNKKDSVDVDDIYDFRIAETFLKEE